VFQENVHGRVKITERMGFGFIAPDDKKFFGEKDIFFHAQKCNGVVFEDLSPGDRVSIEAVVVSPKGFQGFGISKI
jgi:cold shock CspA family protein